MRCNITNYFGITITAANKSFFEDFKGNPYPLCSQFALTRFFRIFGKVNP